jgi:hypothetical protein
MVPCCLVCTHGRLDIFSYRTASRDGHMQVGMICDQKPRAANRTCSLSAHREHVDRAIQVLCGCCASASKSLGAVPIQPMSSFPGTPAAGR